MRGLACALALTAVAFALLLASPMASAGTLVPGTDVQVVALDPTAKTVHFGETASFGWGVFNGDPRAYDLQISVNTSDANFTVQVQPATFTVGRGELREVYVNVTAPADGDTRSATVWVRFETLNPVASFLVLNATVTAREPPATLGTLTAFLVVGAIIAIGFAATYVFERTRIPDILILIVLGLLLGPVALTYLGIQFVPPGALEVATPYFTAMALMFILFDGGINLRLGPVVRKLGLVALHTGLTFTLTLFGVAAVTILVLGYPLYVGLLLGAILGGTSSAVVIGIVRVLRVSEETKIVLILESVLTDVLCVVTVLAVIEFLRGGEGASPLIVVTGLGRAFLVSLAFGVLLGMGWLVLLRRLQGKPFAYMLTIAALFGLYAFTELMGGSGAMAAFVFGLVLGNHAIIGRRLRLKTHFVVDDAIRRFHGELSFVIRTFFFVFLGIVFTLNVSGGWFVSTQLPVLSMWNGTFLLFIVGVVLIFLTIVAVRVLAARVVVALRPKPLPERKVLWSLMGRGLAAAVLASLAFSIPAFAAPATPGDEYYRTLIAPYQTQFLNIAFFIILLTVGATTVGVFASERALGKVPRPTAVKSGGSGAELLLESELDEFLSEPAGDTGPAASGDSITLPNPEEIREGVARAGHRRSGRPRGP